jgi:hypothetical protein
VPALRVGFEMSGTALAPLDDVGPHNGEDNAGGDVEGTAIVATTQPLRPPLTPARESIVMPPTLMARASFAEHGHAGVSAATAIFVRLTLADGLCWSFRTEIPHC